MLQLTYEMNKEIKKASQWAEKIIGFCIEEPLEETAVDRYEQMYYDDFYNFDDDEMLESVTESVWNEAEHYVDFYKGKDE